MRGGALITDALGKIVGRYSLHSRKNAEGQGGLMRFALRDIIADKKGGELVFYTEIPSFAKKISIKRAVELYSAVTNAEDDISLNCSVNTVLTALIGA